VFVSYITDCSVCVLQYRLQCLCATEQTAVFVCYSTDCRVYVLQYRLLCLFAAVQTAVFMCYITEFSVVCYSTGYIVCMLH